MNGKESVKEVCREIREARRYWEAHDNGACRRVRARAMERYEALSPTEKDEVPQELRVWLRYRSEKYFGEGQDGNGRHTKLRKSAKNPGEEKKMRALPDHAVAARVVGSPVGRLVLVSSRNGLCGVYFGHRVELSALPKVNPRDRFLNQAEAELGEYFAGMRREFSIATDARGSAFQREVWRGLKTIPFGETRDYGALAELIGNEKAARAVGMANGANPISIIVPCHRVIGKNGSLTGFGGGLDIKRKLLDHEVRVLRSRGR